MKFIRYMITDRRLAGGESALVQLVGRRLEEGGVDFVQVREKDLEGREMHRFVEAIMALPNPGGARIIVNSRMDVATACGAHGVHLPAGSPAPKRFRKIAPAGFQVGVSCHTIEEARAAEAGGADYVLFGPVFRPISKSDPRPPHGLEGLREAAAAVRIPVLALGGITQDTQYECVKNGAAGIAGISLFA